MTPTVALIGANGHGAWHRRRIQSLSDRVRLVGLADVRPLTPPAPDGVPVFPDHRSLLAAVRPDVVVICTPPHTHLPIALDAIAAGCDLLLEKPPVASLAAHRTLLAALASAGAACQVGFQALGSQAWVRFRSALAGLGPLDGITAAASWKRDDDYYARSPWAGRRVLDGRPVIDGALANPLAHAVMQALASASAAGAGRPRQLSVERYRTRPIDVDDTAFARVTFDSGLDVVMAVTLAGEDFIAGEIAASGPAGAAVLEYPTDRVSVPSSPSLPGAAGGPSSPSAPGAAGGPSVPSSPSLTDVPGRTDLLTNLLDHRESGTPLLVPLSATSDFTTVLEALTMPELPPPHLLNSDTVAVDGPNRTITGINAVIRASAKALALPSELDVPWARPPITRRLPVS
jgi:predicted dehydrogenase